MMQSVRNRIFSNAFLSAAIIFAIPFRLFVEPAITAAIPASSMSMAVLLGLVLKDLIVYFMPLLICVRAYAAIGERFDMRIFGLLARSFATISVLTFLIVCCAYYQSFFDGTAGAKTLLDIGMSISTSAYKLLLAALGLATFMLRKELGRTVWATTTIGAFIFFETLFMWFAVFLGQGMPAVSLLYLGIPVFETIFVIAGLPMMLKASRI